MCHSRFSTTSDYGATSPSPLADEAVTPCKNGIKRQRPTRATAAQRKSLNTNTVVPVGRIVLSFVLLRPSAVKRLHQMCNESLTVSGEHVDDRKLYHGVAARLLTHGGACHIYQHLCCEGRVVDAHIELQTLVLGLAADAFAHEVDAMSHVAPLSTEGTANTWVSSLAK